MTTPDEPTEVDTATDLAKAYEDRRPPFLRVGDPGAFQPSRQEWHEPDDGEALPPRRAHTAFDEAMTPTRALPDEGDRIAEGVRAVQQARHEGFTTEAVRDGQAAADRMAALIDMPAIWPPPEGLTDRESASYMAAQDRMVAEYQRAVATGRPEVMQALRRADLDSMMVGFNRQVRRDERVAQVKAFCWYAAGALMAIAVVVSLCIGWGLLTNAWRLFG